MSILQFAAGALFLLMVLRIAHILATSPIGELAEELLYLRMDAIRWPATALLFALLLEVSEYMYPALSLWFPQQVGNVGEFLLYVNVLQALLIVVGTGKILLVMRRYTSRGLRDRIRDTMETLALGQAPRSRRSETPDEPES